MRRRETKFNEKIFKQRVKDAKQWLKYLDIYDYVVENEEGKLDEAIQKVFAIIKEHTRPQRFASEA